MKHVAMAVVVKDGKVLLVQRRFPPLVWGPPAGFPEYEESMEDAAIRETLEETGLACVSVGYIGELAHPEHDTILYLYACSCDGGIFRCSYESKNLGWFDLDALPEPFSPGKEIFLQALEMVERKDEPSS